MGSNVDGKIVGWDFSGEAEIASEDIWCICHEPDYSMFTGRAKQLGQEGITVVAIQASEVVENVLDKWIRANDIPFPVGTIRSDDEKTRSAWGVRSLPWLILTDKDHIVRAEGFGLSELDEKLAANKEGLKQ